MARLDLLLDGTNGTRSVLRGDLYSTAVAFKEVQDSVNELYDTGAGGGDLSELTWDPQDSGADADPAVALHDVYTGANVAEWRGPEYPTSPAIDAIQAIQGQLDAVETGGLEEVTIARDEVTKTETFVLERADAATTASGGTITVGRVIRVDPTTGAVVIAPSHLLVAGDGFEILVENDANPVTLELGNWLFDRTGDIEEDSAVVTNIDETGIEAGFGVSASGIPDTTVDSLDPLTLADDAEATIPGVVLTFDAGIQGSVNGRTEPLVLLPGRTVVQVDAADFGIEMSASGSTDEFKDQLDIVTETADKTVSSLHLGRIVLCDHGSTAIDIVIPTDANLLANATRVSSLSGAWFAQQRTNAADVTIDGADGVTIKDPQMTTIAAPRALANVGSYVFYFWVAANTWQAIGDLEAAP